MADNYDSVVGQLQSAGLLLDGPLRVDGKIIRCKVEGDRERRGWYCLHEIVGTRGDHLIVGTYGVWRGTDAGTLKVELEKSRELSPEQRAALRKRLDDDRRALERERANLARKAALRATRMWARLDRDGESTYLLGKGVQAHGLRFSAGTLFIPLQDASGQIHGLEIIRDKKRAEAAGKLAKEFWPKGLAKKGHWFTIGAPDWLIIVAEGYATAASIYEATGIPCVVAFDAGNLLPVVIELHKRYPRAKILIAADDDSLARCIECKAPLQLDQAPETCPTCSQPHKRSNAGISAASTAALAVGGAWMAPRFPDPEARWHRFAERGLKATDYNDLHAECSLATVRAQVEARLSELRWSRAAAERVTGDPGGGGGNAPLRPIASYDEILERFSLVYGMNGVVFDAQEHQLVALSDMRDACIRKDVYKAWSEHPDRAIVRKVEVGFDPTGRDANIRCNLWAGWPTTARAGRCDQLLGLLRHMCAIERNAGGLYDWMLRWLAYPIQHPGAKMKSALVLHGPQGTGKNLFFESYMAIFGPYGRVIDQDAIEDKFNDWASRKLFLIADEVVARSDLYHVKNKLKGLITGDWIRINPKNVGSYEERNHVNLVFLSNETMPVILEADDRRHCVVWTPEPLSREHYQAVLDEIAAGGIAALHDYLLKLDLRGFTNAEHPPVSDAKSELINLSLDSTSRFFGALEAGELVSGKLGPALTSDVYELYRVWCLRNGLRAAPLPKLASTLKRKHGVTDARKRYTKGYEQTANPAGILYLGDLECPLEQREADWLGDCITHFANALKDYQGAANG